ncbi:MAG: SLBB domain-containing protein [Pseudomonadota bacterium]
MAQLLPDPTANTGALSQAQKGGGTSQAFAPAAIPTLAPAPITNAPQPAEGEVKPGENAAAASTVLAPEPKESNDFQDFIRRSTGKTLPLFGYSLFNGMMSTYAPVDRIPVTADYVVGPGDEVVVRAWGQIDIDYRATVDRNGDFYIPKVGNVNVAGVKFQDLQGYMKAAIGRVFRNFELNVSLGQLRSIQVFVVGQARHPGSYTVSSLSTLVNTLFASGGPSGKGSMRRIQLKRDNKVVTEFDMYDMLVKGDKSKDVRVLPGDVIYIPAIGPLVAIGGSVNVPAIYEIKGTPTLQEAIDMAGGLTTTAEAKRVTLERIDQRKVRVVDELNFDAAGLAKTLTDGDLVTVRAISPRFENAVTLRGNVAAPARFPWHDGMRLKDLIPSRDVLITPDYWIRKNGSMTAEIEGQSKLRNDVKNAFDEVNWDYAVIERLNLADLTTTLIPFNLGKVVLGDDPQFNLPLQAGDVVTIFSKNDIRVPVAKQTKYIRLEGEIGQSGLYTALPGETLRQIMARIGNVTPQAYLFGAQFTRESTRLMQQEKMDAALDKMERETERNAIANAQNASNTEEVQGAKVELEGRRALLARMRAIKATGRIPLELDEKSTLMNLPDVVLEDGDRLLIPTRPSVVAVVGSVYNENAFLYRASKRVEDYLSQAGGMTKDADLKSAYVIKADGSVISHQQSGYLSSFSGQRLAPGDTIVIPEQANKVRWLKEFKEWTQILYNIGIGAAALQVLK